MKRFACTFFLLLCLVSTGHAQDRTTTGKQLVAGARSFIQGLIPGNEFLTLLEGADAIAVAAINIKINLLQKEILLDSLDGTISEREADQRFRRLEKIKSSAQNAKNRALGGHRDQGGDPFGARFLSDAPLAPTLPATANFTIVAGTEASYFNFPAIWGGGDVEVGVSNASFSIASNGTDVTLTAFELTYDSFQVNGQSTGLTTSSILPGSTASVELTDITLGGFPVTQFEAHFETALTNDLYPASNPLVSFTDVIGFITDVQEVRLSAVDAMIAPGFPGEPPVDPWGMFYAPVRASFDPGSGLLTFTDNIDEAEAPGVAVLRTLAGAYQSESGVGDPLVGAELNLPALLYLGQNMDGDHLFADAAFAIQNASGDLVSGTLTDIHIDGATFQFLADFTGATGPVLSDFAAYWQSSSDPFLQLLGPVTTLDLVEGSEGFTLAWQTQTDFVNGSPEPAAGMLGLIALGVLVTRRRHSH